MREGLNELSLKTPWLIAMALDAAGWPFLALKIIVVFLHCKSIQNQSDCLKTNMDIFKPKYEQKLTLLTP